MKGLLHFGMPKTMSTSIQQLFLQDASQKNFYLGKGPTNAVPSQVQYALETELLQIPDYHYNATLVETVFKIGIGSAEENGADTFIVSDENIVLSSGDGFESHLKRLKAVMPEDTVAVIVIREQMSWLKSFYKHRVTLEGLRIDFDNFLKYQAMRGSKGLLGILDHVMLVAVASKYFPKVEVVLFEDMKQNPRAFQDCLKKHDIDIEGDLPRVNIGVSDAEAYHIQKLIHRQGLNVSAERELKFGPDDMTTMEANRPMFDELLMLEHTRLEAVTAAIRAGKTLAKSQPDVTLDYTVKPDTQALLYPFFKQVNQRMADIMGIPLGDYGYLLPTEEELSAAKAAAAAEAADADETSPPN